MNAGYRVQLDDLDRRREDAALESRPQHGEMGLLTMVGQRGLVLVDLEERQSRGVSILTVDHVGQDSRFLLFDRRDESFE